MPIYILNVSRNGRFYCRIEMDDGLPETAIKERAKDIRNRFPAPEFLCELTKWQKEGRNVPF